MAEKHGPEGPRQAFLAVGKTGKVLRTYGYDQARKFRTKEGCQAFIDEFDEGENFKPTEHEFLEKKR